MAEKKKIVTAVFRNRVDAEKAFDYLYANGYRDSEINAAEAALSTEVLVAAYRSAANREVVTLPLPR